MGIGLVLSKKDLEKYYEIKKLEFFNCLINIDKNHYSNEDYKSIIANYKKNLEYLGDCLGLKKNYDKKNNSKNISGDNNIEDENKENDNLIVHDLNCNNDNLTILGDSSYNLAFLEDYKMYSLFDLLY